MVVMACTMVAVTDPVAFGQLAAEKEPRGVPTGPWRIPKHHRRPAGSIRASSCIRLKAILPRLAGTRWRKIRRGGPWVVEWRQFGNGSLANSAVVGAKAGGFFPESLNWFGVEAELYNTTPHIEQQGAAAGSHMRVTTLAINAIARAQFACEKKHLDTEQVTERFAFQYVRNFAGFSHMPAWDWAFTG